jgi:hypothetical protein
MPLTTAKRSRESTPVATHSFNMVKRHRSSTVTLMGNFVRQAISSKHSTLTSTYESLTLPRSKAKSRPQLQVELPPSPSFEFIGLSPITSFLTSSSHNDFNLPPSAGPRGVDQCDSRDELLECGITHGLEYNMLCDCVTPEK